MASSGDPWLATLSNTPAPAAAGPNQMRLVAQRSACRRGRLVRGGHSQATALLCISLRPSPKRRPAPLGPNLLLLTHQANLGGVGRRRTRTKPRSCAPPGDRALLGRLRDRPVDRKPTPASWMDGRAPKKEKPRAYVEDALQQLKTKPPIYRDAAKALLGRQRRTRGSTVIRAHFWVESTWCSISHH